jgi:hypothetical protein
MTLFVLLLLPLSLSSQSDTPHVISVQFDTTWNHHILESDLILYVEIQHAIFVTQAGSFTGKILKVYKGEFNDTNFSINLDLIEWSQTRWDKRLSAIFPGFDNLRFPYRCVVGFTKENKTWNFIKDPRTKRVYHLFMSDTEADFKHLLKRLWMKKLMKVNLGWW